MDQEKLEKAIKMEKKIGDLKKTVERLKGEIKEITIEIKTPTSHYNPQVEIVYCKKALSGGRDVVIGVLYRHFKKNIINLFEEELKELEEEFKQL